MRLLAHRLGENVRPQAGDQDIGEHPIGLTPRCQHFIGGNLGTQNIANRRQQRLGNTTSPPFNQKRLMRATLPLLRSLIVSLGVW